MGKIIISNILEKKIYYLLPTYLLQINLSGEILNTNKK